MKNLIKTYFKEYVVAQKACNEFNKKHWKGTVVLSVLVGLATWGSCLGVFKLKEIREEKKTKRMTLSERDYYDRHK